MASHFDFLAQARPASLYKLLEKLSMGDAAIVLTGLPKSLAIQALAYYPEEIQELIKPAMLDARMVSDQFRAKTAQKIRTMLEAARSAKGAKPSSAPAAPGAGSPTSRSAVPPVPSAPMGPASAAFVENNPSQNRKDIDPEFSGMDPAASVLTGSVPDELPKEASASRQFTPITPKFSSPKMTAKKRAASGSALGNTNGEPPVDEPSMGALESTGEAAPAGPRNVPNRVPQAARPKRASAPVGQAMNMKGKPNPYTPNPPAGDIPAPVSEASGKARQPQSAPLSGEEVVDGDRTLNSGELIGMAISDLGQKIKRAFSPATEKGGKGSAQNSEDGFKTKDPAASRSTTPGSRKKPEPRPAGSDKPVPWVPRTATQSPINGPALPGKPPPVSGDPFQSPLAKAGLLDLIGRAQEKFMPKGTGESKSGSVRRGRGVSANEEPVRRKVPLKPGRPEPREGVVSMDKVRFDSTPRVIGPRPRAEELVGDERVVGEGVRRMDGKAILAAILRSSDAKVRGVVERDDPVLFRELRGRMFYFDDLIYTEESALARVFTAAPADRAALALKFAAPVLRDRVLRAVSPGRARVLLDCPKRAGMDDVEAAQKEVLGVALKLQSAGRILIDPRDPDLVD